MAPKHVQVKWNYSDNHSEIPNKQGLRSRKRRQLKIPFGDVTARSEGTPPGYTTHFAVERYWRDARLTKIFDATSEIQLKIISDRMLGKAGQPG